MSPPEKLLRLTEVFQITNRAEENIRQKIQDGRLRKYAADGTPLANPLQETGFFKLSEVLAVYGIEDYHQVQTAFRKKRQQPDSVRVPIVPAEVIQVDSLNELEILPDASFDTCISFFAYDPALKRQPFTCQSETTVPKEILANHELWITEIVRLLNKKGNYLIHSTPELLPYYGVYLDPFMVFKYWIVNRIQSLDRFNGMKQLVPTTNGTLFYLKSAQGFRLNRIREVVHCTYCGRNIKDYGGKALLIHQHGAIISDIWKTIVEVQDGEPSSTLLTRLINLSCTTESRVLLAPYTGVLHDRYT